MALPKCTEYYPDIYERLSDDIVASDEVGQQIRHDLAERNARRKRLYVATRYLLRKNFGFDPDDSTTPDPASFPGGFGKKGASAGAILRKDLFTEEQTLFAGVYGLLLAQNYLDPSFGRQDRGTMGSLDEWVPKDEKPVVKSAKNDFNVLVVDRFVEATTEAVKVYNANRDLFLQVFRVLAAEGTRKDADGHPVEVTLSTKQLAEISRRLIDDRVDADDPQISRYILNALDASIGGKIDGRSGHVDIDLPDLEAGTAVDIVPDNVRAVAAVYFSAMLEEMKFYAVTEKVAEHFVSGMLPITRGTAGEKIFEWIRGAPNRFNEVERRGVYGRVLGVAQGGATDLVPNREFSDLWIRFLSTVSLLSRDVRSTIPQRVSPEQVHKTARDLAVNMSLHGYGIAHFAAVEMQNLIRQMKEMLSRPELLTAYGVNDVWQLNDRVSQLYLNGSVNGVRNRTMAKTGAEIIQWLAQRAPLLASVSLPKTLDFLDDDLVFNVDRWLAVTGTGDTAVEKYTEPIDLMQQPTVPAMPISSSAPAAVRSTLDRLGLGAMPTPPGIQ